MSSAVISPMECQNQNQNQNKNPIQHSKLSYFARFSWWTSGMFIIYTSLYFTICKDLKDERVELLELNLHEKANKVYRWYTYSLLHGSNMHYGINMMGWIIYGTLCEIDHGPWRTGLIQFGSIIGGAMAAGWEYRLLDLNRLIVIGASGGVYGMMSSLIGNLTLNWKEMSLIKRVVYPAFLVCTIISDVIVNIVLHSQNVPISYSAHVGGFVFGVLGGLCLMRNIVVYRWETRMRKIVFVVWTCITLASAINIGTLNE